jgi:putative transposase
MEKRIKQARKSTVLDSYIRWYNEKRIKTSLGSLSPIEYRESLGLTA